MKPITKTKRNFAFIGVLLLSLATVAFFQNCGKGFMNMKNGGIALNAELIQTKFNVAVKPSVAGEPCGGSPTYCRYWKDDDQANPVQVLCVSSSSLTAESAFDESFVTVRSSWTQALGVFAKYAIRSEGGIGCSTGEADFSYHVRVRHQTKCRYNPKTQKAEKDNVYLPDAPLYAYFTASDITENTKQGCFAMNQYDPVAETGMYTNIGKATNESLTCRYTDYPIFYGIKVPTKVTSDADSLAILKANAPNFCKFDIIKTGTGTVSTSLYACSVYETGSPTSNKMSCKCAVNLPGYLINGMCFPSPSYKAIFSGQIPDLSGVAFNPAPVITPVVTPGSTPGAFTDCGTGLHPRPGLNRPAVSIAECEPIFAGTGNACYQYSDFVGPAKGDVASKAMYCTDWSAISYFELNSGRCSPNIGLVQCVRNGKYDDYGVCRFKGPSKVGGALAEDVEITPNKTPPVVRCP